MQASGKMYVAGSSSLPVQRQPASTFPMPALRKINVGGVFFPVHIYFSEFLFPSAEAEGKRLITPSIPEMYEVYRS
jgi:hypothetical protein